MATTNKILGGAKPAVATLDTLYTVPSATQAVATIFIANQSTTNDDVFSIELLPAGQSDDPKWYIAYDADIGKGTAISFTSTALGAGDTIKVASGFGYVSFVATGLETTY